MQIKKPKTPEFKGFDDYIEVFKAGTHTDSKGRTQAFTTDDLDQVVSNFNSDNPVPHVITHKEMYSPFAYAQTTEIKRDGDSLYVKADKVDPQFEKLVQDGRLFERSIRLRPTDNGWKLGHVAWLGAEPPAVEGLAPVQFESGETFRDFSMDSYTPNTMSRMMRRMRDFIIEKFGVESADKVIPDYEIESLSEHANSLRDEDSNVNSFSKPEPNTGDDNMSEFSQADIDAAKKEAAKIAREEAEAEFNLKQKENDKELTAERNKRLTTEYQAKITAQVDAGQLLPAQAEGMAEFMLQLSDADDAHFEFSAGEEGKQETLKKSPLDWFNDFTKSIGKQIDTSESDAGTDAGIDSGDAQAIADAAVQFQKQQADNGITVSTSQAVAYVTKENK